MWSSGAYGDDEDITDSLDVQDMRQKFEAEDPAEVTSNNQEGKVDRSQGAARAISVSSRNIVVDERMLRLRRSQSFIDPGLDWKDIPWFKSITKSTPPPIPSHALPH